MENPLPLADFAPTEVPHCFLPNSKKQSFRPGVTKRSPFQVRTLLEVSRLPEFAYFVVMSQDEREDVIVDESYESPIAITWVAKNGTTTIMRMSDERIVHESVLYGGEIRKLDDPVYKTRVEGPPSDGPTESNQFPCAECNSYWPTELDAQGCCSDS